MKPEIHKIKQLNLAAAMAGAIFALTPAAQADSSFTINTTSADAFLASGSSNNPVGANLTSLNFGGAGTLAIAPASSPKGEFDSVIQFNSSAAVSSFNNTYGAGNWAITGVTLFLASNFATQGEPVNNPVFNNINAGNFGIDLISDNSWVEGTGGGMGTPGYPGNNLVSFNSIPTLLSGTVDSLGTFTYTPPGNANYLSYSLPLNSDLLSDAGAGGDLSLYFFASTGSQVSYLFNSKEFGSNHPELMLTVTQTPEPGTLGLIAIGSLAIAGWRKRRK